MKENRYDTVRNVVVTVAVLACDLKCQPKGGNEQAADGGANGRQAETDDPI